MPRPLLFVLVDGLSVRGALNMPRLTQLVSTGNMSRWRVQAAQPTWSRPNYATIITGVPPSTHGIQQNEDTRRLTVPTLFERLHEEGERGAIAGYHWWGDLLGDAVDASWYYASDETPDQDVLEHAYELERRSRPAFLLVHPMSVDNAGHQFGGDSLAYERQARDLDVILSDFIETWLQRHRDGSALIGSDHGMTRRGHGGSSAEELEVCYFASPAVPSERWPSRQEEVRSLLEYLLFEQPGGMR